MPRSLVLLFTLVVGACAHGPEASREPAVPAPAAGIEGAYDAARWKWIKNRDGRALLTHAEMAKCFVDPQPPQHVTGPGLRVTRETRTIGGARYEVATAYEGADFWEAVYLRAGSAAPLLGVYAGGKCQQEAERIIENYEKRR